MARCSCVGCVWRSVECMDVFVGEVGSWAGKVWLCRGVRLCVGLSFGFVCVCVWCVLLVWVSEACVRRGGFLRPPALKTSVVVGKCLGGVAKVLGLGYLDRGVGEASSCASFSLARFGL